MTAPAPTRALTPKEQDALRAIVASKDVEEMAVRLGVSVGRARNIVKEIADALPNPDELPALRVVLIYAGYLHWADEHRGAAVG